MARLDHKTICSTIIRNSLIKIGGLPNPDISIDHIHDQKLDHSVFNETTTSQFVNSVLRGIRVREGNSKLSVDDLKNFETIGALCDFVYKNQML